MPPGVIAANRSYLAQLLATNIFGQNTSQIATTEAQYGEFWAQDGEAMDTYFASSATASNSLAAFEPAPKTTNDSGTAAQACNGIAGMRPPAVSISACTRLVIEG